MEQLRAELRNLGYSDVYSHHKSGNLTFKTSDDIEEIKLNLRHKLSDTFDYEIGFDLLTLPKLQKIVTKFPYPSGEGIHNYVILVEENKQEEFTARLSPSKVEQVSDLTSHVYWSTIKGHTRDTDIAKLLLDPAFKEHITVRKLETLSKLTKSGSQQ